MGDAWPGGPPIRLLASVGRLRQAWVVKTRRNLCGELLPDDNEESGPPPEAPAPPPSSTPSGRPSVRVGESEVSLWRRNDLLLKSNNGEADEKLDISSSEFHLAKQKNKNKISAEKKCQLQRLSLFIVRSTNQKIKKLGRFSCENFPNEKFKNRRNCSLDISPHLKEEGGRRFPTSFHSPTWKSTTRHESYIPLCT